MSTKGKIGNWNIDQVGLSNIKNVDAYVIQRRTNEDGTLIAEASIGTNLSELYNGVGTFINHAINGVPNQGVQISVKNGTPGVPLNPNFSGNLALSVEGDIHLYNGNVVLGDSAQYKGRSVIVVYKGASGDNFFIEFVNGIMIRFGEGTGS